MRQSTLHQIEGYYTILAATERHIEDIDPIHVFNINVVYFLYCFCGQFLQQIPVLFDHSGNINKAERLSIGLWLVHNHNFRWGIKTAAFGLGNLPSPVEIIVGFRPHIGVGVILCIIPIPVKSKNIQFFCNTPDEVPY